MALRWFMAGLAAGVGMAAGSSAPGLPATSILTTHARMLPGSPLNHLQMHQRKVIALRRKLENKCLACLIACHKMSSTQCPALDAAAMRTRHPQAPLWRNFSLFKRRENGF
jgi:hypothetical protein